MAVGLFKSHRTINGRVASEATRHLKEFFNRNQPIDKILLLTGLVALCL